MHLSSLTTEPMTEQLSVSGEKITDSSTHKVSRNLRRSRDRGFTLVEILVVMAIIATLLGLGVGAIKNMASSKGVDTAVPLADSIFAQARQVAKSTGAPTRVVIYADSSGDNEDKRDRYLRMIGVATGRDGAGLPVTDIADVTQWKLVSRASSLPSNTYFNAKLSNKPGTASETAIFPGSTTGKNCYVYQFNSEGALVDPSGAPVTDGQFVVQAGKLRPGATAPDTAANATRDVGGFKIWANGRMAKFRSPNQIINGSGDAEF